MEQQKPAKNVLAVIEAKQFKEQLARALPNRAIEFGSLNPDRIVQLARTLIRTSASLAKCTPISIMACVVEASQLGLELERVLGHAYLVPFKGEATLIVGYRGFAHLMFNTGMVNSLSAEVVRRGDKFKRTLGTRRELIHEPAPIPSKDDPEQWLGAYAAVQFVHGGTDFEYLEKVKIEAARNRSRSWQSFKSDGKSSPWATDTEEMWRKTAIRRLAKRMPTSTTDKRAEMLQRASMLDEYAERKGLLTPTLHGFDVNPEPPEPDPELEPTREVGEVIDVGEPKDFEEKPKKNGKTDVPKAKIPPAPKPADDPPIGTKEQTELFSAAVSAGWKVPDEVREYLRKNWKVDGIRDVRRSQLPKILAEIKAGT